MELVEVQGLVTVRQEDYVVDFIHEADGDGQKPFVLGVPVETEVNVSVVEGIG